MWLCERTSMTSRSSLPLSAGRPCMRPNCCGLEWRMATPELLMNCPASSVPDTACTSKALPRGPQSLEESTTMGSVLGSISASIMEIFRMSDTEGLSPEAPELDSGISLAAASPLLKTGDGWRGVPKVILVTVALCVMIGCKCEMMYVKLRTAAAEGKGDIKPRPHHDSAEPKALTWLDAAFSVLTGWCACSGGGWDMGECSGLWWEVGACWSFGSCGVTVVLVGGLGVVAFVAD